MRANLAALCISVLTGAGVCSAQTAPQDAVAVAARTQPEYTDVYCSGFVSDARVPDEIRVISGEQSDYKIIFGHPEYVYLSRGEDRGVKVGDRYTIVRPERDPGNEWFQGQNKLSKAAGTLYRDAGQVRVVNVQPKVSIAQITFSCGGGGWMQRGDIARPFEERPTPPYKDPGPFDHFAPVSGKPVGNVISSLEYFQELGRGNIAYVNLGASRGVKVGDYLRLFRYQGNTTEWASQKLKGYQYKVYGFGRTPTAYQWKDLPREVLGEGIVLNVSRNAAAVLITYSTVPMYTGDYAEIE
jgi:hypothetical protein